MPKTFPGEAPEPDSLNVQSGRSHTKTAPGGHVFRYWIDKPRTEGLTGEQIQAGATAHQWAPEIVRKENGNTGYRCLNFSRGSPGA